MLYLFKIYNYFYKLDIMTMRKNFFLLLILMSLTSCMGETQFELPKKKAPIKFTNQKIINKINENTNVEIDAYWWKSFNDPLLNKLINDCLKHNLDILAATTRLQVANKNLKLAGIKNLPEINLNLGGNLLEEHNVDASNDNKTTRNLQAGLNFSFSPDFAGQQNELAKVAIAEFEMEQAALKGIMLKISSEVIQDYAQLRGIQEKIKLLKKYINLQEETLNSVRAEHNVGLSSNIDLQKSIISISTLKADLSNLEEMRDIYILKLSDLSSKYRESYQFLLRKHTKPITYKGRVPNLIPIKVLNTRTDVRQGEANLKKFIARIGVAEADYYPTFTLNGNINIGAEKVSSSSLTDILIGSLSAIITNTLFDGGKTAINVEIAKKEAEEALIQYKQIMNRAILDVESSLYSTETIYKKITYLEDAVNASKNSLKQSESLYKEGFIDSLKLIDTRTMFINLKQRLIDEESKYSVEIAKLFLALGISH